MENCHCVFSFSLVYSVALHWQLIGVIFTHVSPCQCCSDSLNCIHHYWFGRTFIGISAHWKLIGTKNDEIRSNGVCLLCSIRSEIAFKPNPGINIPSIRFGEYYKIKWVAFHWYTVLYGLRSDQWDRENRRWFCICSNVLFHIKHINHAIFASTC